MSENKSCQVPRELLEDLLDDVIEVLNLNEWRKGTSKEYQLEFLKARIKKVEEILEEK